MTPTLAFAAALSFGFCNPSPDSPAQQIGDTVQQVAPKRATAVSIERPEGAEWGPGVVYATIGGTKTKVGLAHGGWLIGDGRYVALSSDDGAGGYENEGQSLRLFDVETGALVLGGAPLLREYYMIESVSSVTTPDGRVAVLVNMADGGLGAPHLAVVDPARGEVFRQQIARAISTDGGTLRVGVYTPDQIEGDGDFTTITPSRIDEYAFSDLLSRPVIVNPHSGP